MTEKPMIIDVYRARDMVVTDGAARGEPISFADDLVLDDVYQVAAQAQATPLALHQQPGQDPQWRTNNPPHAIYFDCCLTLMTPQGDTREALILVELADDRVAEVHLMPLGPLHPHMDYRLVDVSRHSATRRFAQAGSGAFAGGTRITMGDGRMCPVETLSPGDMVLTRDHGPQPLRWIGKTTLRASGSFAPVVISKGALHNDADLVLRADHRLFVYQRNDHLGAGRAEVLIRARHLIDGDSVFQRTGGFIDYYQLILDAHHIIYAEGISAESQRVDARSRPALPDGAALDDHPPTRLLDYEVDTNLITPEQAVRLLRKATSHEA